MENTKYGRRREGRWTPIRAKAQDTRANPNSWEIHLVRKRWDIGLLRELSPRIMMMNVLTWRLERDSNPRPFGQKASNLPMRHHVPQYNIIESPRIVYLNKTVTLPL